MFGFTSRKELKKTIAQRDYSIKILKEQLESIDKKNRSIEILKDQLKFNEDKVHEESLKVVRLVAENATLKQRIIYVEGLLVPSVNITMGEKPKPSTNPKLLAWYNRGKSKTT